MRYILLTLLILMSYGLRAQKFAKEDRLFMVETDPIPFALKGFDVHFGFMPSKSEHFSFGLSIMAGLEYPDQILEINEKNKGQGWSLKVNQGMGLWANYYFNKKHEGWYAGLQLFTQELKLTNSNFPNQTDLTNTVLVSTQVGYVWFPFKNYFYLKPWAGIGYHTPVDGTFEPDKVDPEMEIGNQKFYLDKFMPFATVHLGYVF
jgi:hypothetical protein